MPRQSGSISITRKICVFGIGAAGVSWVSLAAAPAAADDANGGKIEEVIVTAQRREQRLQDVPLAVSAFNAQSLQNDAATNLTDLDGRIPNVQLSPVGAYPFASAFTIRGIGFADVESSFEAAVGEEIDGVYLARNVGALMDFSDIDDVSVLRGPQGTLYGRNTIGGVVSVRSKRPTGGFDGDVEATFGDNGRREFRGDLDAPVIDGILAARVSYLNKSYDGYEHNAAGQDLGGEKVSAGRGSLLLTPSDNFDATLIVDSVRDHGTGPGMKNASLPGMALTAFGYPADTGDPYVTQSTAPIFSKLDTQGVTLEANWDIGPLGKITSVSGYRSTDEHTLSDFGGAPIPFLNAERRETHDQESEEVRLASHPGQTVEYVVGFYFLHQHYALSNFEYGDIFGGPTVGSTLYASQSNDAYAGFGQVDYHVTSQLTLTLGGRYNHETKDFTIQPLFYPSSTSASAGFNNFSPKVGVNYAWTPDFMTYADWARGFRAGGFNGRAGSFTSIGPYGSERVDTFEIGEKAQLLDRHLTLNGDVFHSIYSNMQENVQRLVPGSTTVNETVVSNAGEALIDGVELEADALLGAGFKLSGSVGYLDARFSNFMADLVGNGVITNNKNLPLTFAPHWTADVAATYEHSLPIGILTVEGDVAYQDRQYTSFSTLNLISDFAVRPSHALVNASIALSADKPGWRIALWVKNLTNLTIQNNTFPVATLSALRVYEPPRTFGVDLSYKF